LGEDPLDEEGTPQALGLHDGDVVYLRPRQEVMPPVHFDDLVDSVATTLRERPDSWRPRLSRRLLTVALLLLLGVGLALLMAPGPRGPRAAVAAVTGVLLLAGAASASRAMGDAVAGTVFGTAAIPFLALADAFIPAPAHGVDMLGVRLLAATTASLGVAALAVAVIGASAPLFLGVGFAVALGSVGGMAMVMAGMPLGHAAAIVALVTVVLGGLVPGVAFRLSGLRLPPLPSNADQLQEGIEPHEAGNVIKRSALVDEYLTWLYLAVGTVTTAALTALFTDHGWPVQALMAALSALGVLHGSRLGGLWPRLALTLPGLYGMTLLAVRLGQSLSPNGRLLELAVLVLIAAGLALASWTIPGRRLLPHWGHATNLLHSLAAVSLLPLALYQLGFYQYLRGLGG
jgi:type VII secretion integral membrane protein EccD